MMDLAVALERSGKPFIWVVRLPLEHENSNEFSNEWLPAGFETLVGETGKGLLVRRWAQQAEILAHPSTRAFFSHYGWNGGELDVGGAGDRVAALRQAVLQLEATGGAGSVCGGKEGEPVRGPPGEGGGGRRSSAGYVGEGVGVEEEGVGSKGDVGQCGEGCGRVQRSFYQSHGRVHSFYSMCFKLQTIFIAR